MNTGRIDENQEAARSYRPGHTIVLVPYQADWPNRFELEADAIAGVLGTGLIALHHVGSTAIPGIVGKPVIDILAVVEELPVLELGTAAMERLGYEAMGEFGLPGRRYFRKNAAAGVRTHQVHGFEGGSAEAERLLAFRDYLRSDAEVAQQYSRLKQDLVARFEHDMDGYSDGKTDFIRRIERLALANRLTK